MSYYADLDVSTIDELPPGRSPIVTKVVNQARRDEIVARIRTGELVAASSGLGHLISQGRLLFKSDQIIVGMVTIGIIGILLDAAVLSIQRILLRWKDTR